MRISDWSSDVCSSDLGLAAGQAEPPRPGETPALVVCNGPALSDERIAIVDPATQDRCPDGKVGEIWVIGPNVADSYYKDAKRTGATFGAAIGGAEPDPRPWLSTGDLGYLIDGRRHITGHMQENKIVKGRKL